MRYFYYLSILLVSIHLHGIAHATTQKPLLVRHGMLVHQQATPAKTAHGHYHHRYILLTDATTTQHEARITKITTQALPKQVVDVIFQHPADPCGDASSLSIRNGAGNLIDDTAYAVDIITTSAQAPQAAKFLNKSQWHQSQNTTYELAITRSTTNAEPFLPTIDAASFFLYSHFTDIAEHSGPNAAPSIQFLPDIHTPGQGTAIFYRNGANTTLQWRRRGAQLVLIDTKQVEHPIRVFSGDGGEGVTSLAGRPIELDVYPYMYFEWLGTVYVQGNMSSC